ncbi:MAG: DUF6515 family protein [Limisphaerales bacterium]
MKLHPLNRITLLITLLAVGAFCPNLRAGWGSLQGNNRSAPARSAAPRPQPQPSRPPQVNRSPRPVVRAPAPHQEVKPVAHEQPRIVVREQPQAVARARANETDRRRMDIDQDRRQSYFWSDYHKGMRIDRLPGGYRRIGLRGHFYFYFEGVFYDDESSGYVVIAPPVDAEIPELPPGAETVVVGDTIYYYAAGAFYVQQPDGGYVVVAPPMGVTVSLLPPDAVPVVINGTTYYQSDGTYYLPVMQNGVVAYLTIPQP